MAAQSEYLTLAAEIADECVRQAMRSVPETEPSPEQVAQWEAELQRDMRAAEQRVPVAMIPGSYELPLCVCKDGSVWQMFTQPDGDGGRLDRWTELPPIPGSQRAMGGEYLNGQQAHEPMFGSADAEKPFLVEDQS
jgi:hypothetical protein